MNNIDYKAVVEILENFLKKEKTEILGISVGEEYQLRQAIENLIQENKELKEKAKNTMGLIGANYINKDKIKEKIKEYDKMIKATYGGMTVSEKYRRDVCLEIKQNLQELLEEGE